MSTTNPENKPEQGFVKLWNKLFKRYRRLELRFVDYSEGDKLIRESEGKPECDQWVIAKEEDNNRSFNRVYLERRIRL